MDDTQLTSNINVELVTPDVPSDDTIVDAARISFNKRAELYTDEQNSKLRKYLFNPKGGPPHWSPFAMPRFTLTFDIRDVDFLQFFLTQNLAGFSWIMVEVINAEVAKTGVVKIHDFKTVDHYNDATHILLNGSLWAWYQALPFFSVDAVSVSPYKIASTIKALFPDFYDFAIKNNPDKKLWYFNENYNPRPFDWRITNVIDPKIHYETLRITAPIFVFRQYGKHQVHFLWNEVSRRYVRDVPQLFFPETFYKAPEGSVKQGSSDEVYDDIEMLGAAKQHCLSALDLYEGLINENGEPNFTDAKMAPEEARMFLPQNMMTTIYWTGSIDAFNRVIKERLWKGAQKTGTRDLALQIQEVLTHKHGDLIFKY